MDGTLGGGGELWRDDIEESELDSELDGNKETHNNEAEKGSNEEWEDVLDDERDKSSDADERQEDENSDDDRDEDHEPRDEDGHASDDGHMDDETEAARRVTVADLAASTS